MSDSLRFLVAHGYSVLFAATLMSELGLPIPAELALLATGALAERVGGGMVEVGVAVLALYIGWRLFQRYRILHELHLFHA